MDYKDLTAEQKAKADACKTPAEVLEFAKAEGLELSDADLEKVNGGWGGSAGKKFSNSGSCPKCDSDDYKIAENGADAWCVTCGYQGKASSFFNH